MLLVNLSREKIILQGNGWEEELPYFDIERKFPVLLIDMIKKYNISKIWVINGPGSFTTLRLGCVTINTVKQFGIYPHPSPLPTTLRSSSLGEGVREDTFLEVYSCSKLDIYTYAVEQGLLPEVGMVFMGQKKNMRKVAKSQKPQAISGWECDIVNRENLDVLVGKDYFIDACEHILLDSLDREKIVEWKFDGEKLKLLYSKSQEQGAKSEEKSALSISLYDLGLKPVEKLEPGYIMDPQIG